MKKAIKRVFNFFGIEVSNLTSFRENRNAVAQINLDKVEAETTLNRILFILDKSLPQSNTFSINGFVKFSVDKLKKSKAQIFQDLFVLYFLNEKRNGFFVEFGATNGISLSNTFLLEKEYSWKGILAEPAKIWHHDLHKNRSCIIDTKCVWSDSTTRLNFNESETGELSQIDLFLDNDFISSTRNISSSYKVSAISLNELLEIHNAPLDVDYLSIDTEGSEYEILQAFNFNKFNIKIITVEHNFSENRDLIFNLLSSNGYKRVFERISLFDDWYIKNN